MADQTLAEQAVVSPVNVQEFSKKIKEKYPEYKDVDDLTLAQKIVEKYPEYKDRVSFDQPEVSEIPPEQPLTYMQKELRQKFPENYTEEPKAERETSYIPEVTSEGKQLLGSIPATRPDLSAKHPEYFAPKISDSYQSEKATTIPQGMGDKFKPIDQEQLESELGGAQIKQDRPLSKVEQLKVDYIRKTKGQQEAAKFEDGIINGKGSFGGEIVDQLQSGGESLLAATYGTPGYLYDILGSGYRALGMDVPLWKDSWAKEEKIAGVDINPLSFLEKQKNDLLKMAVANDKEVRKANPDIDKSIIELFQKGDAESINAGLRNIFSSIAQSAPASIAMMTTGGMSTAAQIGLGAAVFGSQNMNEADQTGDYGGVSRDALLAINGLTGSFESAFETIFGAGAVGRGIVGMIKSKGKDIAGKEIKEGIMTSFSRMVIENPWLAPFGESFEEMGTQLSQNIVNKYSGYKPDIKITDGVVDSGIVGFVMGTGMGGGISLAKKAMNAQPITTATIEGQQFTVNNPEDLGIEGKPIFAKDAEGNIKAVPNFKATDPITQTQGEIDQAQQAAADQQALMNGIADPNAQIIDELDSEGARVIDFSNGQTKIIYNGQEVIANNIDEKDRILNSITDYEKLPENINTVETEPVINQTATTEPIQDNKVSEVPAKPKYPLDKEGNPDIDQMDDQQRFHFNTENFGQEAAISSVQKSIRIKGEKIDKLKAKLDKLEDSAETKAMFEIKKLELAKAKQEEFLTKVLVNANIENQNQENVSGIENQSTDNVVLENSEIENNSQNNELQNEDSEKVIQPTAGIVAEEGENTPQENQGEGMQEGLEENVKTKESDIERRRQEELDKYNFTNDGQTRFNANSEEAEISFNVNPDGDTYSVKVSLRANTNTGFLYNDILSDIEIPTRADALEILDQAIGRIKKKINAKYDAELAALENTNKDKAQESVAVSPSAIEKGLPEYQNNQPNVSTDQPVVESLTADPVAEQPTFDKQGDLTDSGYEKVTTTLKDNIQSVADEMGIPVAPLLEHYNISKNGEYVSGKTPILEVGKSTNFKDLIKTVKKIAFELMPENKDELNAAINKHSDELLKALENGDRSFVADKTIGKVYSAIQKINESFDSYSEELKQQQKQPIVAESGRLIDETTKIDQLPDVRNMVDQAASEVNTNPTEAQKEAGNYKKGHVAIQGMDITIENPKGSVRKGVDEDGKAWETEMQSHYGYFKRTIGKDNDHIDTFIGDNPESQTIFVVDQNNPKTGAFDESKIMLGYNSPEEAKAAYLANYQPDWKGFGSITAVPVEQFKEWLYDGAKQRKPFAEYKGHEELPKETSELSKNDQDNKGLPDNSVSELSKLPLNQVLEDAVKAREEKKQSTPLPEEGEKNEDVIRFRTEEQSRIVQDALKYSDINDFIDAYKDADFRDSHSAPGNSMSDMSLEERMDQGDDFNLTEVVQGFSTQPKDYFDPRNGARWYGYDDKEGMQSYYAIKSVMSDINGQIEKNGKITKMPKIKAYRAVPKGVEVNDLIDGDWITFSKEYAKGHGENRFGQGEYKIISQNIPANEVWWDGNDINEWGYDTGKTEKLGRSDLKAIWENAHAANRFRIIGEKGAVSIDLEEEVTTRLDNLKAAREMEQSGKDAKSIRLATGWEKGVDGKWRYEVPDNIKPKRYVDKAKFAQAKAAYEKILELNKAKDYDTDRERLIKTLEDFYKTTGVPYYTGDQTIHNALRTALLEDNPDLLPEPTISHNIEFWQKKRVDGEALLEDVIDNEQMYNEYPFLRYVGISFKNIDSKGSYSPGSETIVISDKLKGYDDEVKSTMLHEIQHAIQYFEGFAKGGNPEAMTDFVINDLSNMVGNSPIFKEYESKKNKLSQKSDDKSLTKIIDIESKQKELLINLINKLSDDGTISSMKADQYKRLAGEVESRNVQTRMNFTPEERRNTLLQETEDVAREDQIVLMEGLGVSNLEESTFSENLNVSSLASSDLSNRPNVVKALTKISDELGEPVQIINSSEIPAQVSELKRQIKDGDRVSAFFYNGQIYLLSDQVTSVSDALKSYLHELIVHKGLRDTFAGADKASIIGKQYAKFNDLMVDVFGSMSRSQKIDIASKYVPNLYNQNRKIMRNPTLEEKALIGEEFLAHISENQDIYDEPTLIKWQQFINRLLQIIRKAFRLTSNQFSQSDLLDIVRESRERLKNKAESVTEDETRLRVTDEKEETINVDGVERPTLNSNGKPIAATEEGIRNFWKWFGDSKVVDDEGRPLVVYHGTNAEFNEFKFGRANGSGDSQLYFGKGFYFTNDKNTADSYSDYKSENTMDVYLKIDNPFISKDYRHSNPWSQYSFRQDLGLATTREIQPFLIDNGYDGVVHESGEPNYSETNGESDVDYNEYVVFNPNQIKSATGNNGSFDPQSNDIRFQIKELDNISSLPKSKQDAITQIKEDFNGVKSLFKSIDKLKEMEESKVGKKVAERRVIIKQISAYKKGYRAGVAEKRLTLQVIQRNIIKYANDNMNYDDATRFEITQLLTAIKNANTPATIEKVFDKIDDLASRGLKRKLTNRIERAIKYASPKLQSGKPTGKTSPEAYQAINKIKQLMAMTADEYDNYLELIADNDVESMALASVFGNLKEKSIDETFEALKLLNSIISEGRTWYKDKIEALKTRHKELIAKAVDDITGGKGIQSTQNIRSEKGVVDKNSYIKEFLGKNQSFEWLLDLISNNKKDRTGWGFMQDHFGDLANKSENLESKGLRESIELVNKKAFEIFGKEKSALAKIFGENSRVIKKSGVTYATNDGRKEIPLSQNEAYKRWMEMSDPTLFPTFEKMGWDSQSLTEIEKFLNPKVLSWAKWQVSEFFPEYYKRVNDVYKKMYYVDLPFNPSYSGFLKREKTSVGDKEDTMLRPDTLIGSVANSSLKSRIKNIRDIVLQDGDQALAKHIAEMEHFMAWAETIREIRAVLSSDSVQDAIKKEHGNNIRTVLNERINSLVRGGVDRGEVNYLVDWVRKNYVTSALGVNISLTPKQMTAMFSYLNDITIMDYIKGAAEFIANPSQAIEVLSQSEFVQRRYKKGWTHEIEAAMKKNNPNTLAGTKSVVNSIRDALMLPVMLGDKFAVYSGYPVYAKFYKQFKADNPAASEQAAHDFALNKFERVTKRTQQSSDVSDTSRFQETSFGKVFMMFKNAQQQYFRYEMAAINNLIKGKGNTAENAKIILITHVVLPVIFQMVANWFTDEDDDKENKRLLRAALLGPIDGLMIAGDIVGYGLEKMMGEKWSYSASPMLDTVQDLGNSIQQLVKYINEPYPENEAEDLQKALDFAIQFTSSTMTGVPYEPVKKLYNKATGEQKKTLAEEEARAIIGDAEEYLKFLRESAKRGDKELHSKLINDKKVLGAVSLLTVSNEENGRLSYNARITKLKKYIKYYKSVDNQKKVDEVELKLDNIYKEIIDKYSEIEFPDNYKLKE